MSIPVNSTVTLADYLGSNNISTADNLTNGKIFFVSQGENNNPSTIFKLNDADNYIANIATNAVQDSLNSTTYTTDMTDVFSIDNTSGARKINITTTNTTNSTNEFLNHAGQWSTPQNTTYGNVTTADPGLVPNPSSEQADPQSGNKKWFIYPVNDEPGWIEDGNLLAQSNQAGLLSKQDFTKLSNLTTANASINARGYMTTSDVQIVRSSPSTGHAGAVPSFSTHADPMFFYVPSSGTDAQWFSTSGNLNAGITNSGLVPRINSTQAKRRFITVASSADHPGYELDSSLLASSSSAGLMSTSLFNQLSPFNADLSETLPSSVSINTYFLNFPTGFYFNLINQPFGSPGVDGLGGALLTIKHGSIINQLLFSNGGALYFRAFNSGTGSEWTKITANSTPSTVTQK